MPRARTRRWRLLAVLAAAGLVMAACGDDDGGGDAGQGGAAKKTVAIGFVGPLTGDNANLGINIRDGMKVALAEANEASDKYTFVMKEFDTQGDPTQAPGQATKYIADQEIIGIVGPTFSGETKAVLPLLQPAGLVMVSASATNIDLPTVVPDQTVFHRIIPDDNVQSQGLTEYINKTLKAKKGAYIHDNTEYGKGLFTGVVDKLKALGFTIPLTDAIKPGDQDYSSAVNKVKSLDPDIVFYGGYYSDAGRLKKQLTDAGVKGVFISGDGSLDKGFIDASGAAGGEGAQITCPCRLASADAGGKNAALATKYKAQIGKDPGTYSSEGYDALSLLVKGIEEGNDTRPTLLKFVEELDSFDGVSKTIEFSANGNVKAGDVFVYEVKGGKLVELGKTSELAK